MKSRFALAFLVLFLCALPAFPQPVLRVSGSPLPAADSGMAELSGPVTIFVSSGTTAATRLTFSYPLPIANGISSGISLSGSGALAGARILTVTRNSIEVELPAGGGAGDSLVLKGVRLAVAGSGASTVDVLVTAAPANSVIFQGNAARVINALLPALTIDPSSEFDLELDILLPFVNPKRFIVSEGFAGAFTGDGLSTKIKLLLTQPEGLKSVFPQTVKAANSRAQLVLESSSSGSSEINSIQGTLVYRFVPDPFGLSEGRIESFVIEYVLEPLEPLSGRFALQATLAPGGPHSIPSYVERFQPEVTRRLFLPGVRNSTSIRSVVSLLNPMPTGAWAEFELLDDQGARVSVAVARNPVSLDLQPGEQVELSLTRDFGLPEQQEFTGTIAVSFKGQRALSALELLDGEGRLLQSVAAVERKSHRFFFPRVDAGTIISIFNPNAEPADVVLRAFDRNGILVAESSRLSLVPKGSRSEPASALFQRPDLAAVFVRGESVRGVAALELFADSAAGFALNGITTDGAFGERTLIAPHVAIGAGFSTEIHVLNLSSSPIEAQLTAIDQDGIIRLGVGVRNPARVRVEPRAALALDLGSLMRLDPDRLFAGTVRLEARSLGTNIFDTPAIAASAVIAFAGSRTAAAFPLVDVHESRREILLQPLAAPGAEFVGLALHNAGDEEAVVAIDLFSAVGQLLGSSRLRLGRREQVAKLLSELSAGAPAYLKISASRKIMALAIAASADLRSFAAVTPNTF